MEAQAEGLEGRPYRAEVLATLPECSIAVTSKTLSLMRCLPRQISAG